MTEYRVCTCCVMDTSDPYIEFDESGVCSHCREVEEKMTRPPHNLTGPQKEKYLDELVAQIKTDGLGKPYDCIIGVSGGVDSTFVAYKTKQLGLRPLAVHLDNGWDAELAVHNIEKICKKLDIDLFTHVMDWNEFKDIQLSFLKASTPDSEIPTDHAIKAILLKLASKNNLKTIITGNNFNTESILPFAWSHGHSDWKYIRALHKKFGTAPFKTFPACSYLKLFDRTFIRPIRMIDILDYFDYNKEGAVKILIEELGWEPYKGKHHESLYTKFFQSYILPRKFGFDKRRAHLSSLIKVGQLSRDEALKELETDPYSPSEASEDKEYVAVKLGITVEQFDEIMDLPPREFKDYPSYENSWYYKFARKLYRLLTGRK
ncbi:MAG: N-acetyl sugar amidotransferase [bacterium]|nr:N-acetyl sugar amidotransferase [bacterium]